MRGRLHDEKNGPRIVRGMAVAATAMTGERCLPEGARFATASLRGGAWALAWEA
jgi:hypothetical protein